MKSKEAACISGLLAGAVIELVPSCLHQAIQNGLYTVWSVADRVLEYPRVVSSYIWSILDGQMEAR